MAICPQLLLKLVRQSAVAVPNRCVKVTRHVQQPLKEGRRISTTRLDRFGAKHREIAVDVGLNRPELARLLGFAFLGVGSIAVEHLLRRSVFASNHQ